MQANIIMQIVSWLSVGFPIFIGVLGIICMAKVIQISEDVRRTRNAIYEDVKMPTPHYLLVVAAAVIAVVATIAIFVSGYYVSAFGLLS